ncbi:uncharacterized protein LOC135235715 [Anguilla rostrata]|uniref:uncharacterized protein LOC135235715 n=1 Tax=Anguilla rostrata TaxID=7938 RepID=UPI0030D125D8
MDCSHIERGRLQRDAGSHTERVCEHSPKHQTIHDPKIPYVGPIYGGLKTGMSVYFKGRVLPNNNRFHINLQYGDGPRADTAMHFNPRFAGGEVVVFNSYRHGGWKNEERPPGMPFIQGEAFEMVFVVAPEGYKVVVNGQHYYTFKHRMPVERVTTLTIAGDVEMQLVNIIGGKHGGICGNPAEGRMVTIPHLERIQGGLKVGMSVHIQGTVPQELDRFHVNLRCGHMRCSDIALHFNPRFAGNGVVVFNSFQGGGWRNEERPGEMPFTKGDTFDLIIAVTSAGYQVTVNDQHFYLFRHRIPVNRVNALEIDGCVSVHMVNITGGGQEVSLGHRGARELVVHCIPFVGSISGGLRVGMSILFYGTVHQNINRFHINLQCGEMRCSDIAMHFNPRFAGDGVVVFNSYRHGWKNEERVAQPFSKGEDFELVFIITSEGYQVNVNGQGLHLFRHRMPVERVKALAIAGDVSIKTVNIIEGEPVPEGQVGRAIVAIPHVRTIRGGLRVGMTLLFKGMVLPNINRFHINLQCGEMRCSDIAMHFNPRFAGDGVVVFNSFRHGWKNEERVAQPFSKGENFELLFIITSEGYQVKVNGQDLHLFRHRMPVERVKALAIAGDVTINFAQIIGGEPGGCIPEVPVGGELVSIPCIRHVPGGLKVGLSLYFKVVIPNELDRFHINLQCGEKDGGDIAMHFNPRFAGNGVVVFNTFRQGGWENEERPTEMPFLKGETYDIVIVITSAGFQVNVNGVHFYTFKHRMPVQKVGSLSVAGDVSLLALNIIGGGPGGFQEQPGKLANTPYVRPIFVSLRSGMSLYVQGTVPQQITRFNINFKCGKSPGSDIALHFNPRFCPCELVVFNSLVRRQWKKEERVREMPFQKGEDFELLINITSEGYQVIVNGQVFYTFMHRMPVGRVTAVEIEGDVFVQTVDFIEGGRGDGRVGEIMISKIPYVGPISGGLRPGMSLFFQGTVLDRINRFHINLQCGQMKCSDIALHFNPRFRHHEMVVFNSFQHGWKREERVHTMPFRKGASFELVIAVTPIGYQVLVNGLEFYLFRHRIPIDKVRALEIAGDVTVQTFTIIKGEEEIPAQPDLKEVLDVPCVRPITGGLRGGMTVQVKGTIPSDSNRFSINLDCGEKDGSDNALHFNPRFDSNLVVFNTFRNGGWENEERPTEMPLSKGQDFEVFIIVTSGGYQVKVNDQIFYLFRHRMPVRRVQAVRIVGDVSLHLVNIFGGEGGIAICPGVREIVQNTPYMRPISSGLKVGMSVYIQGIVPQRLDRFHINFKCGDMTCSDIAFHFNPRFCPGEVVVCNNFRQGWKQEERVRKMPFTKGEGFEMVIQITSQGYQVNVNGRLYYTFKHRMPVDRVTVLEIGGKVFVQTVNIIGGVQRGVRDLGLEELVVNSIPFVGPITRGLKVGTALFFQGTVHRNIKRFHINLRCGQLRCSDIALHFNPRFGASDVVVFNNFRHGWKNEERVAKMPFTKGEGFETIIAVTSEGFQVIVNGVLFYLFKHRIPVERVRALEIGGGVSIQAVRIVRTNTPYIRPISGGLKPGMSITLQGTVPHQADRFSVNLLFGDADGPDNAFHFNPRFKPSEVVVFNSARSGSWEEEERVYRMPFTKGGSFEIVITVTLEGYQVEVNGQPFYLFKHRIPVEQVKSLEIHQDVSIHDINIFEGEPGAIGPVPSGLEEMKIPYVRLFPNGLKWVTGLVFLGRVPSNISRFSFNLMCGDTKDIALHFNPRFDPDVVVFNTFRGGSWENEERPTEMPLRKGEDFEIFILIKSQGYQVIVNGQKFYLFNHRIPLEQVTSLEIGEEVTLYSVEVIEEEVPFCPEVPTVCPEPTVGEPLVGNLPYLRPVSGSLKPGMSVYFQGTLPQKIRSFHINFRCGDLKTGDVAFHFRPWFCPCEVVVMNTMQNGGWQTEERVTKMLFSKGAGFEMIILITSEGYQVTINDSNFHLFNHRIPVEQVTAIEIGGDVSVQTVDIIEGIPIGVPICPGGLIDTDIPTGVPICPGGLIDTDDETDEEVLPEKEVVICKIPQARSFPSGLTLGMILVIEGIAPIDVPGFAINFKGAEPGDIALHINVRFEPSPGVVVFNTFRGGNWEQEERPDGMPFRQGEKFLLVISITAEGFQVNVNGRRFHFFKHRMPVETVGALSIAGDVSMKTVNMIGGGREGGQLHPSLGRIVVSKIPHVGPVYGGLRSGLYLYFKGTVPQEIKRFHINLQYGQMKGCDKALHFNPRFEPEEVVVFNSFRNGSWEQEERPAEMPFTKGEDFELVFIITSEGYQVNVNGRQFYLFKHRMPVEQVNAIKIAGEVSMETVNLTEVKKSKEQPEQEDTVKIPHLRSVHGGLRSGTYLYFKGTIPQEIKRFHINLQYGEKKGCDKALHFNPRFEPEEVVVFNSFRNGSWEQEERPSEMPFRKGEDFELFIFVTAEGYQVNVNGRQFHLFNHRMPVDQVSALNVVGDVSMKTANVIKRGPGAVEGKPDLGTMVVSKIPHVGSLFGGLRPGMYLYFRGTVPQEIERFHINLQYGKMKGCDKALHFNPRFKPEEVVVFNSFRNGGWENEERPTEMPFRKGEDFELVFFITAEGYQVYVNGRHFHLFNHRMPVEQVSAIKIVGDVSVQKLHTIKRVPGHRQPGFGQMAIRKIPHVGRLFGGLRPGMSLYFRGTVPKNINRFHINLQCGEKEGGDTAMHFNPRFAGNGVVVFNTFRNGGWENEERPTEMPFREGEQFVLVFIVTSEGYQVNVNGREFYLFKHRIPLEHVSAIKIAGEVSIETGEITQGEEEEPEKEKEEKIVPSIPHVGPISGGLRPGMSLCFSGTIPEEANRFSINLHCGDEEGCDNAFHFNPRFEPSGVVVFNTFRNGSWENEERVEDMPFQPGDNFELVFIVTSEGYKVKVNDRKFYLFKHRMPMENVTTIRIFADVSIQTINITEGGTGAMQGRLTQGKIVVDKMPFVEHLHHSLKTGMYMYFRGKVDDDIKRFHINLQNGDMKGCAKALHFNPRFKPNEVVVFNTFQNGKWGKEERVNEMPFRKGEEFELVIIVTAKGYQVIVNGRRFYMFKHRLPVNQVSALKIAGDVSMETIDMTEICLQGYQGRYKMAVTKIPHVSPVLGGLRPGMYLYFRGTVPEEINRFHINLQYGQGKGCDKALHFNPRFTPEEVVVFNSFRNGGWQQEERSSEMPFRKGEEFELLFIITSEGYQVIVNGRPFYLFKHRMLVENVAAIKIVGDISIKTANMIGGGEGGVHPSLGKMVVESIPHVGPVYGGLWPGMFVVFRGTVPQEIKSFSINLQYGQIEGCDTALHFNPRFEPEEVVVLNSFRNGSWENEERPTEMPFRKGEDFEIVFVITSEGYQVYVNGRYFCLFKHRMPVEHVSAIKIVGEVTMKTVDMTEQGKGAPELPPPVPVVVSTTPQLEPITGGLKPGMYLYFKGTVPQEIKRFSINLQNGQIKGCDKALHFNPRFDTEEVVVFNSFKNGSWENEERPSEMPFCKGEDFEIVIIVTTEGYQVNVNGRQFHFFKHRIPLEQVSAIKIAGDVAIQSINTIQGGPKQPGLGKIVISKIPHLAPVYGGLRPGMYLYFKGTIPQDIKRFAINLQYGQIKGCDKALHFNPRFEPEEVVVFNSFKNGSWENEERPSEMPFRKGEDFELIFFITRKGYQVNVNGRQFHFFEHRMPVDQVSAIKIVGEVTMQTLNMIEGGQPVDATPGQGTIAIKKIPHVGPVYGGLRPGMSLFFLGTVPEDIKSFAINLQYGTMTDSDIAFHFNPRFEPSEKVVVFNSFKNGSWENEERVNQMPFQPGTNFGLVFIVTKQGYKVLINGERFYVFKHRMPVQQVSALKITGTILIMAARMIEVEDVDEEEEPEEEEVEEKEKPAEEEEPKEEEVEEKEKPAEEEEPKEEEVEEKEKPVEEEEPKEEKPAEKEEELEEEEVLSGDVKPGMAVYFKGTVPNEITRFAVDLRCGDTKDSDIAFRFESRFEPSEVLVFNSFKNGSWEEEERVNEMPFRRGESFELVFHVLEEGYQVYVARRKIYLFKHRIPVEQVTSVQVIGEISMQTSNLLNIGQFTMTQEPDDDVDETTQVMMSIPGSLKSGLSMSFQGMIPDESTRFTIDLQCGDTEGCDTAFRFNPRLETSEVVFNSFRNGSWEEEEKVVEMPFIKGESFLLVFMLKSDGYQVNVNGCPLYMFKHRMVLEQVRGIRIFGGVSIQNVNIVEIVQEVIEIPEEETEAIQAEAPIPGSLKAGTTLTLLGTIPEETKSFSINLQCGEAAGCDTAFHFNPKFETSEVEFNTFRNGSWEEAEKVDNMPFTQGKEFELTYIITAEGYQVNVNGAEFYLFKHRISVDQVKVLQIAGDVSVTAINIVEGAGQYPTPAELGTVQTNIPVPGCLKTWMTVSLQGLVPAETDSFSINLQCGDTQGCDTAFHFSSQFKTSELVFNSFRKGHWEEEERVAQMPFKTGENFTLDYTITLEGYEVSVNGHFIHTFMHRMPVAQVSLMQIIGDVSIIAINIIETSPSVTPLPSGLKPGTAVIFQGVLPSESNRFSIDLQCGETEGCDTAFQFQPQLEPEEVVVCNSFQNGSWETEERLTEMPFRKGEDFELVYNITAEGYQVKVNGQQYHMFKHRIPVEQVRALLVAGNVSVPAVHIIEGEPFIMEETAFETVVICAPYVMPIPGGFKEASSVNFRGSIPEGIPSFSIDLQCGEADGSDTALRFNPQFEPAEAVVFNSFRGGSWETEERVDAMPFRRGESFEVTFHITPEGYQVKVNGAELHMFKHRIPVEQVSALKIVGNVTVETVNIIEGDFGAVPPSCFGQIEATGSIGGETWTCGVAEVERGDGPI